MARRLEFLEEAIVEATAAREWYARRSSQAAARFAAELQACLDRIVDDPLRFPRYAFGTRRCRLRRFPYVIVFRTFDAEIEITAVAHGSRRMGYWRHRN